MSVFLRYRPAVGVAMNARDGMIVSPEGEWLRREDVAAVLGAIEWSGRGAGDFCPSCRARRPAGDEPRLSVSGHRDGCALAALLYGATMPPVVAPERPAPAVTRDPVIQEAVRLLRQSANARRDLDSEDTSELFDLAEHIEEFTLIKPTAGSIITLVRPVEDEFGEDFPAGSDVVVLDPLSDGSILVHGEHEDETSADAWVHEGDWHQRPEERR